MKDAELKQLIELNESMEKTVAKLRRDCAVLFAEAVELNVKLGETRQQRDDLLAATRRFDPNCCVTFHEKESPCTNCADFSHCKRYAEILDGVGSWSQEVKS